jgi:RsiW-degrading membrane proteinase PrsW (M82 family)
MSKEENEEQILTENELKSTSGNGIGVGVAIGAAYGASSGNMGQSLALSIALGTAIGAVFDFTQRRKSKPKVVNGTDG